MSKGAQIAVGASLVVLLIGWYGYTNLREGASFQYYQTLEEMLAEDAPLEGRPLRVHGYVAAESIERSLELKQVRFAVQNDPPHAAGRTGAILAVRFDSLETPDLFKDGAEVVVEGRLEGSGAHALFVADNVLAKCPSKFQAKAGVPDASGGGAGR
jgi:cytochrome c-type biogenesis protein CcmE